jgi:anti-sigma regulatory factor (Ser/Thr protein kinase)
LPEQHGIEAIVVVNAVAGPQQSITPSAVRRELRLRVDRPVQLAGFRRRMRTMLDDRGLHEGEREIVVLACSEALNNALQACDVTDCNIEVVVSLIADYVCVEVRDADERFKGVCLDLVEVAGPTEEHGRGLYLMRTLMQSLELVPRSRGTLVRMVKKLEAQESGEEGNACAL